MRMSGNIVFYNIIFNLNRSSLESNKYFAGKCDYDDYNDG